VPGRVDVLEVDREVPWNRVAILPGPGFAAALDVFCFRGREAREVKQDGWVLQIVPRCGALCYAICRLIVVALKGDVWCCEGFNHLLKGIIERAHAIKLPLLDSRARIKKHLGVGVRGASTRWSVIKDVASGIIKTCLPERLGPTGSLCIGRLRSPTIYFVVSLSKRSHVRPQEYEQGLAGLHGDGTRYSPPPLLDFAPLAREVGETIHPPEDSVW
jgi:hypothetical protein